MDWGAGVACNMCEFSQKSLINPFLKFHQTLKVPRFKLLFKISACVATEQKNEFRV